MARPGSAHRQMQNDGTPPACGGIADQITDRSVGGRDQEPMNFGARLLWNASTPSRKSSEERSRL